MTADEFNNAYPVGTQVVYYPILPSLNNRDRGLAMASKLRSVVCVTRSAAWMLASGHPVVRIEGKACCVALSHIQVTNKESIDG